MGFGRELHILTSQSTAGKETTECSQERERNSNYAEQNYHFIVFPNFRWYSSIFPWIQESIQTKSKEGTDSLHVVVHANSLIHWRQKKLKLYTVVGELVWNLANGRKPWTFGPCCNKCPVPKQKCDCVRYAICRHKSTSLARCLWGICVITIRRVKKKENYSKYECPKQAWPDLSCFTYMVCSPLFQTFEISHCRLTGATRSVKFSNPSTSLTIKLIYFGLLRKNLIYVQHVCWVTMQNSFVSCCLSTVLLLSVPLEVFSNEPLLK